MKDNAKVTLTIGQLRRLVQEENNANAQLIGPFEINLSLDATISVSALHEASIREGIDVYLKKDKQGNIRKSLVSYAKHDKGIATTAASEPTKGTVDVSDLKISPDEIQVFSILKRTPLRSLGRNIDGNPLIYALKQENHYEFKTSYDKQQFECIIQAVLKKFAEQYFAKLDGSQTTIVLPSGNALNSQFAMQFKAISEELGHQVTPYEDALRKVSTDEIRQIVFDDPTSDFNSWIARKSKQAQKDIVDLLEDYLTTMEKEHNRLFSFHYVKDSEIRTHITKTMEINKRYENITDSNVLLIDDAISYGQSIRDACEKLCSVYNPKSIVALTLFSKAH